MTILFDENNWPTWWNNYTNFHELVFLNDRSRAQFKKDNIEYHYNSATQERHITFTSEDAYLMFVLKWS